MAIQVMAEIWEHSKAVGTRLLILLAMGDRARKEDAVCWPGRATIASQARVGVRDVEQHIAALIDMGEVGVVKRGGRGPGDTTVYQITVGRYKGVTPFALKGDPPRTGKSEASFALKGEATRVLKGERKSEESGQIRAKPASLDPKETRIDPAGIPPTDLDPSPGGIVVTDGLDAGMALIEDPSTGRLRPVGQRLVRKAT